MVDPITGLIIATKLVASHFGHAAAVKGTAAITAKGTAAAKGTVAAKGGVAAGGKTAAGHHTVAAQFGSIDPSQLTSSDIPNLSTSDLLNMQTGQIDDYNLRKCLESAQESARNAASDPSYAVYHQQQVSNALKNAEYYARQS